MKMMKVEYMVKDIIFLVLKNYEPLKKIGISKDKILVKVRGYDENGIWIYHPGFIVPNNNSSKTKIKTQKLKASILIPWVFIVSIVHFPDAEGYDYRNPFDQTIGF